MEHGVEPSKFLTERNALGVRQDRLHDSDKGGSLHSRVNGSGRVLNACENLQRLRKPLPLDLQTAFQTKSDVSLLVAIRPVDSLKRRIRFSVLTFSDLARH